MNLETVERCGRTYAVKNGVESAEHISYSHKDGKWFLYIPAMSPGGYGHPNGILTNIAMRMGDWHTTVQAAERLVELGAYDKPPSTKEICGWARNGLLPGSVKVPAPGQGGAWRIPEAALVALAERRQGR